MCVYIYICNIYTYCILGSGVHVTNRKDCCIGTCMAMWFAASIPITYIWHFFPCIPPQPPSPTMSLPSPHQETPVCDAPLLCPCVLIVQHQPKSENMWCLIFCSCVSLLRIMVFRFIHVPTKYTKSSFFMAV